jgi:hypothetical protein
MSRVELDRRLQAITSDDRLSAQQVPAVQQLARACAAGRLREVLADAGLHSNGDIASACGVTIATASKWQTGAITIPQTHHLLHLTRRIAARRVEAA